MGIRTIEVEKTVRETVDVKICDRCGYECEHGSHKLYKSPRIEYTDNARAELEDDYVPMSAFRTTHKRIVQRAKEYVTLEHNGYVRVCADCYRTMFGWTEDE